MRLLVAFPTFNRSAYLKRAISSFLDQIDDVKDDVEVVLVVYDNASSDNTPSVCEEFSNVISIIRRDRNIGADANILDALLGSTADFIWIFGDDDYLKPNALFSICGALKLSPGILKLNAMEERDLGFSNRNSPCDRVDDFSPSESSHFFYSADEVLTRFGLGMGNFSTTIFSKYFVDTYYKASLEPIFQSGYSQIDWIYGALSNNFSLIHEMSGEPVVVRIELAPRGLDQRKVLIGLYGLREIFLEYGYSRNVVELFFARERNAVIVWGLKVKKIKSVNTSFKDLNVFFELSSYLDKLKFLIIFLVPGKILELIWVRKIL